jgi:hypothetical protein
MREGQLWAAAPIRQAGPAASKRARERRRLGPAVPGAGERAGSDGGLDNWIVANGNEGERALAGELWYMVCVLGLSFWLIMNLFEDVRAQNIVTGWICGERSKWCGCQGGNVCNVVY